MGWNLFSSLDIRDNPLFVLFLHKSWIWWTLGHDTKKNSYFHFHNASKEYFWSKNFLNFMHRFKIATLAIFHFCQKGTFEPVHEIQIFFWPKEFFWGIIKVPFTKDIHNFFQGPPSPRFRSVKVQTETFFKKDSQDFENSFYLGLRWIPSKPGKQNWKVPFFGC